MDFVSHGLWTDIIYRRFKRKTIFWAVLFGLGPDMVSFGPALVEEFSLHSSGGFSLHGPPPIELIPRWAIVSYQYTHSLIVWAVIAAVVTAIRWLRQDCKTRSWRGAAWLPLLAWALHILIDIPTHATSFFPTPFLFPISNYHFNGISWAMPWFFFTNLGVLTIIYAFLLLKKFRARPSVRDS